MIFMDLDAHVADKMTHQPRPGVSATVFTSVAISGQSHLVNSLE